MFDDVEKIAGFLLSAFHGIVTAYLFVSLTDVRLSEAYFVVLVVFCSYVNIIALRAALYLVVTVLIAHHVLRLAARPEDQTIKDRLAALIEWRHDLFSAKALNISKVPPVPYFFGYLVISFLSAGVMGAGYDYDWPLVPYQQFDWSRQHLKDPLGEYFFENCNNIPDNCKSADPKVKPMQEYLLIWRDGGQSITAGFLADAPFGNERSIVQLANVCHLALDKDTGEFTVFHASKQSNRPSNAWIDLSASGIETIERVVDDPCLTSGSPPHQ